MAKKPTYIGLLNSIANGERGGHALFKAWRDKTSDTKLKETLHMVATREMEHSWAFEKRLCELGYGLKPSSNKTLEAQIKLMKSKASDAEKFAAFGIGVKSTGSSSRSSKTGKREPDRLLQILADQSIDPQTGGLIGRFICEERDSGVQLTRAYKAMLQRTKKKKAA